MRFAIEEYNHNKIFDKSFIDCANQIHIMNDKRYSIKNKIKIKNNKTKDS